MLWKHKDHGKVIQATCECDECHELFTMAGYIKLDLANVYIHRGAKKKKGKSKATQLSDQGGV